MKQLIGWLVGQERCIGPSIETFSLFTLDLFREKEAQAGLLCLFQICDHFSASPPPKSSDDKLLARSLGPSTCSLKIMSPHLRFVLFYYYFESACGAYFSSRFLIGKTSSKAAAVDFVRSFVRSFVQLVAQLCLTTLGCGFRLSYSPLLFVRAKRREEFCSRAFGLSLFSIMLNRNELTIRQFNVIVDYV